MIRPLFLLALMVPWPVFHPACFAQDDTAESDVQSLVDELKALTAQARNRRAADRWLLNALDDLTVKYEWPWRTLLLDERFADGDYTHDPAWQVVSGQFWVDASLGLRSRVVAGGQTSTEQQPAEEQDIGEVLLRGLLQSMIEEPSEAPAAADNPASPAQIYLSTKISNAFALKTIFSVHNRPSESGRLVLGLYQGAQRNSGYLLSLSFGSTSGLDLLRVRAGGSAIIESLALHKSIRDGRAHELVWQRHEDGRMDLLLDGTPIVQTSDRAFMQAFETISLYNEGGDYAIRSLTVSGAR